MSKRRLKHPDYLKNLLSHQTDSDNRSDLIARVRKEGAENLKELTFPQPKDEDWRYTKLRELTKHDFVPSEYSESPNVDPVELKKHFLEESEGVRIVFIDGWFSEKFSDTTALPTEIKAGTLEMLSSKGENFVAKHFNKYNDYRDDVFTQFSSAFADQGYCIALPEGFELEKPIQLLNIYTGNQENFFSTNRTLVVAEKNSSATIVENHVGLAENRYFTVPISEFKLFQGAHVKHVKVQNDSKSAIHVSRPVAHVASQAHYQSYTFTFGAKLFRNDPKIIQTDEEVSFTLDGLVMIKGDQIADTHSIMDHQHAFAESHQLHKVVVDEKAHSIFNGKIFVRQHAQKIDSFQENRNLMLSRDSTIDTKPQLEIFADDVKCSHGATVGHLDQDELFYLQSRGLSKHKAMQLLTFAFALEIINNIEIASLRKKLSNQVDVFTGATEKIKQPV